MLQWKAKLHAFLFIRVSPDFYGLSGLSPRIHKMLQAKILLVILMYFYIFLAGKLQWRRQNDLGYMHIY